MFANRFPESQISMPNRGIRMALALVVLGLAITGILVESWAWLAFAALMAVTGLFGLCPLVGYARSKQLSASEDRDPTTPQGQSPRR